MTEILHIASFIVRHREPGASALDDFLTGAPQMQCVARADGRSIVLCEGESETELMQAIDALQALQGVLGVSLVYHHAEPRDELLQEIEP
ncbi:MAG: nitrate reductase formation protein NapD [Lysobacterales bacterium CG17_big_fil_post_rev_8_21_14_2_50_64_11]|nr:MAG: nitrate reductase formation protein NapD [Xanthomonadales bacterium CG17_big_fil_post_rev_8_21_14_2_50_64_11]PIX59711.1 MAG: nitrate reductase formation protein NapD [Xanthomonadales bacterium CG_4_10_14_3_um_filter_64_11]